DSIETALKLGSGVVLIFIAGNHSDQSEESRSEELLFSEHFACVYCGISLGEIAPRTFSFNSPHGACPSCTGLGYKFEIDPSIVIPDREISLSEGAIKPWARNGVMSTWYSSILRSLANRYGFSQSVPVGKLTEDQLHLILYGNSGEMIQATYEDRHGGIRQYYTNFEGVIPRMERLYRETASDRVRVDIERYMSSHPCPVCQGKRLKPESLAITINGNSIMDITALSVVEALKWVEGISSQISSRELTIANQIIREI
ncbi:unnamed protein product, partial [marine sediment metagenome]